MRILILSLIIGLVGCSIPPFKPTESRNQVTLTIIIDDDLSWMGRDYGKWKTVGSSYCNGNKCTIWVPTINSLDDKAFRVWGKEISHIYYGDYHRGIVDIY